MEGMIATALLVVLFFTVRSKRIVALTFVLFLIGLWAFQVLAGHVAVLDLSAEMNKLLNRSMLIIIIVTLLGGNLLSVTKPYGLNRLPRWSQPLKLPYHTIKVSKFLMIGLLVSSSLLLPAIIHRSWSDFSVILPFALAFGLINASLEELIWRGVLLPTLRESVSTFYAVMITSIGFGLMHLSIGIPLSLSLLFSFGGVFYAFVTLKTQSLYPAITFHTIINIGMVMNGWIV